MLKGFPKLLKFVRVNKFYIPGGNPYLVLHDHRKSSLFTTFMNKEDSIKCHQFVIRYARLVMTKQIFTIKKIKTQKLLLAKNFYLCINIFFGLWQIQASF